MCFLGTGQRRRRAATSRASTAPSSTHDCYPSDLALFNREVADLRRYVLEQDVIYVGGGNTASLLAVWRAHGLDTILQDALGRRRRAVRRERRDELLVRGLGDRLLRARPRAARRRPRASCVGSACPHYDADEHRRPIYHRLVAAGFPAGCAADDGVALHFADAEELVEVVASREGARGYRVEQRPDGAAVEHPAAHALPGVTRHAFDDLLRVV